MDESTHYSLADTVKLMISDDYHDRFKAEIYQLRIRLRKLEKMLADYYNDTLDFKPKCPVYILECQYQKMSDYLDILEARAEIEGTEVDL